MRKILTYLFILYVLSQAYQFMYFIKNPIDYTLTTKIGIPAVPGEIPHQVSIEFDDTVNPLCSGSIINKYHVITSASCLTRFKTLTLIIKTGVDIVRPKQIRVCREFIIHENYSETTLRNDIALIKIYTPFEFNEDVQPVEIPRPHENIATNTTATVSGWGQLGFGGTGVSQNLRKAKVYINDLNVCRGVMNETMEIRTTNICAFEPFMRKALCYGELGGPMTVDEKLIGIMSWQFADPWCVNKKFPNVYTRVSEYVDWIKKNSV